VFNLRALFKGVQHLTIPSHQWKTSDNKPGLAWS